MASKLKTRIGSLEMNNPLLTASGTYGNGREYSSIIDLNCWGALVTKGLTLEPRAGNSGVRIVETPAGILNSIGLQNPGIEYFLREEVPFLEELEVPVIANIAGRRIRDYEELARRLDPISAVAALEVNVSCPNVREGGLAFGTNPDLVFEITSRLRKITAKPLIIKLTPNVASVGAIAVQAEKAGADAVSLINTLMGMEIDIERQKPMLGNIVGGLSGPAVKPVALRMVYQVFRQIKIPIIGMGGITKGEDAVAFLLAGARAVALGTVNFVNPQAPVEIKEYIGQYMQRHNFSNVEEMVGLAHQERED